MVFRGCIQGVYLARNTGFGGPVRKKVALVIGIIVISALITGHVRRGESKPNGITVVIGTDELSFYEPPSDISDYQSTTGGEVRNVILCIGDGMGHSQIAMARIAAAGTGGRLHMERIAQTCAVTTHCADSEITDSAASATALSTGIKTDKGMLGMDPRGNKHQTILEAAAKDKGMMTGIVVSSSVTHATPAGFFAHVSDRGSAREIAVQLLDNRVNVAFGGGGMYFLPMRKRLLRRTDQTDLIQKAVENGYTYVRDAAGLETARGPHVLGLFAAGHMETAAPEPTLAELTVKAIEILNTGENGFFLMVEGSHIDWACHENDAHECIRQTLLFDQAVKAAVDFALQDGRTLVLVTADHETGGLTVKGWDPQTKRLDLEWSTEGHTGVAVPLYALGPGAESFREELDNTEIPKKIAALLGIGEFPKPLK
jgi:alkaline phosphatase